jgi:hypothetical protein
VEVGQGLNWGCGAKGKKYIEVLFFLFEIFSRQYLLCCYESRETNLSIFPINNTNHTDKVLQFEKYVYEICI